MSVVLGISPSSHDSSAALFVDGRLVAAIAEERLNRVKCQGGYPGLAIDAVLKQAGLARGEVTHVALNYGFFPERYFRGATWAKDMERNLSRLRRAAMGEAPKGPMWANDLLKALAELGKPFMPYFKLEEYLSDEGFAPDARVRFFDHHESHAAAAAFYSGFEDASVVTMDGVGDLEIHYTGGTWRGGELSRLELNDRKGASAGNFYMHITELLGFRPLRHEGKVLGLAAFGHAAPLLAPFERSLRLDGAGRPSLDSDFVGAERPEQARIDYLRATIEGHSRETVAAAAQETLEGVVVPLIGRLVRETGLRRLALNGGVFANVKLNQRLAALPEVEEVFVFPGMSDTGNSVGAALLMLQGIEPGYLGRARFPLDTVYWGPEFSDAEIRAELDRGGLAFESLRRDALVERAARAIHAGRVVGWFQGRMEFGPRALGNRSILARATDAGINKSLNDRLSRTEFMPFAPSCLDDHAHLLFENVDKARHAAQFMTITFDVRPPWRSRVPAVVHVDGTARPQLVRRERNAIYHDLIERYRQLSGIPLVLNTSFNVHEEPIVCGPREAARALLDDRIDCLAMGSFWLERPR